MMAKWECWLCDHEYDSDIGDPDKGVVPGTHFEDIPESWVCPGCGRSKDQYVEFESYA